MVIVSGDEAFPKWDVFPIIHRLLHRLCNTQSTSYDFHPVFYTSEDLHRQASSHLLSLPRLLPLPAVAFVLSIWSRSS
jgi:hypothetical protein